MGLFGNSKRNWNSGHASCSKSHCHIPQTKERKLIEKKEGVGKGWVALNQCLLERIENPGIKPFIYF